MRETLIDAVRLFCWALQILIFARVIMSWIPPIAKSVLGRIVYALTDPLIAPIRNLISKSPLGGPGMMLDISPFIALVLLQLIETVAISLIGQIAF